MKIFVDITKENRVDDIVREEFSDSMSATIHISQNSVAGDGYRAYQWPEGQGRAAKSGSGVMELRTYDSDSVDTSVVADFTEADTAIEALNDSDGYILIWNPSGGASIILESLAPLWKIHYEGYLSYRTNSHARSDGDRI